MVLVSLEDIQTTLKSARDRLRHPGRWVRRRGDAVDRRGRTVPAGSPNAVAWSLRGALMEAVLARPASAISLAPVLNALLDQIARQRGFRSTTDMNDRSTQSEITDLLDKALSEVNRLISFFPLKEIEGPELLRRWESPDVTARLPRSSVWRRILTSTKGTSVLRRQVGPRKPRHR